MKKNILIMILVISIFFAGIAKPQVDTNYFGHSPSIIVSMIKQEPDPVEPGKQVEVSFKLDNNGTQADNVVFEIAPEYPFSLLEGESATTFIGTLGTSQYGRQSVIVKYKLKVAQDASDDNHQIKVRYKTENFDVWVTLDNFRIKVQSHDAILAVERFSTAPAITAPGEKTKLAISLKNYATSLLKDIKITINLDKSGATLPFSPIGSTNEKVISYIEPQATVPLDFDLLVDSDATSKSYKVPLDIRYSDSLNKNYSKTNLITIVVGDKPDLGITLERTDVFASGSTGSVVLRLVNKGSPDIKFLNVKVLENENVKVVGADEVYIGKLDSDDFSTAEFKLFVEGNDQVNAPILSSIVKRSETIKIPVQVTYEDSNNNNYKETKEVDFKLYSNSDAKNFGIKKNGKWLWIVVILMAAGAGYYYYKKRKAKK